MIISVINIKTYRGKDYLRCDRKTIYGNPFISKNDTKEEKIKVISQYKNWLFNLPSSHPLIFNIEKIIIPKYINFKELKLGCHCYPEPCHCDVLAEFLHLKFNQHIIN